MRNKYLHLKITEKEEAIINFQAAQKKLSKSNYLRAALGLEIKRPKMIPNPEFQKSYIKPESKTETLENTGL